MQEGARRAHRGMWAVLVLAVWLFLSPFFLVYAHASAATHAHLMGLALTLFSVLALMDARLWERWMSLLLAAWLIVAPSALGFGNFLVAAWTHVAIGVPVGAIVLRMIVAERLADARARAR